MSGLEQGKSALSGEVGDRSLAVDLAQQRPLVRAHLDLARGRAGRERWHGVRAADDREDRLPGGAAVVQVVEQLVDGGRGRDVLAGLLVLSELPGGDRPAEQVGQGVLEVLDHELLDHLEVDVAQVHEELTQAPALQLGPLDLERLGERLRGQRAARHQPDAEHRAATRHHDGVDQPVAQVDLGLVALLVAHVHAARGALAGEVVQDGLDGPGEEGALGHERPPYACRDRPLGGPGGKLCDGEHPNGAWALSGLVNGIGISARIVERSTPRS